MNQERIRKALLKIGAKPISIKLLYKRQVDRYISRIEKAHKDASKSTLPPFAK